jgi:hypothetical protein
MFRHWAACPVMERQMLMTQYYLNSTNQPYGPPVPVTATFCRQISDASGKHTPNGVLAELRMGYTVEVPGGFYMASDTQEG